MYKSKIFIASSGRTLVLAEILRDELASEFCQATVWSEEGKLQPGSTIIEMLEGAAKQYDFAVIILARDDVLTSGAGEVLKARDNCVFEAGHFMSAIGRKRCFLVNSVEQSDLPSDLGGVNSIRFKEPSNLAGPKGLHGRDPPGRSPAEKHHSARRPLAAPRHLGSAVGGRSVQTGAAYFRRRRVGRRRRRRLRHPTLGGDQIGRHRSPQHGQWNEVHVLSLLLGRHSREDLPGSSDCFFGGTHQRNRRGRLQVPARHNSKPK